MFLIVINVYTLWKDMEAELEKLLNVKESRARDLLRYLVKNNMLQKIGATRNIRYIKTVGKNQSQKPSEKWYKQITSNT